MNTYEKHSINQTELTNCCLNTDDYRPIQSTLLTRFTTKDYSDLWHTTNQDYGAFYYQQVPQICISDSLKAKIYQRHQLFQDWLSYQTKHQNLAKLLTANCNNNDSRTIFPSDRNETVRITHRQRFLPEYNNHNTYDNPENQNAFLPYREDGLIVEYIVKKILHKLKCLINSDEYHDVIECAQILVSEILNREPFLSVNEIIDRVITIMITPPDNVQQSICNPFHSNMSTALAPCSSSQPLHSSCQAISGPNTDNKEPASLNTVSTSVPFIHRNEIMPLSDIFEKLNHLENAISKVSNHLIKS